MPTLMLRHGLNIEFDTWTNDYPSSVRVDWYLNNNIVGSGTYEVDSANYFCEKVVGAYNKVVITFSASTSIMNNGYRFLKIYNLTDGISREFYNEELTRCEIIEEIDSNNKALSINEASLVILPSTTAGVSFQRTLPLYIYRNDVLFGKFFVNTSTSNTFKTLYNLKANDYISVLEAQTYLGGMYNNVTASTLFADILGEIPYTLDAELGAKTISGYLPIMNKREALRQVAFCLNAEVDTSRSDGVLIKSLATTSSRDIPPSEIVSINTTQENIVTQIVLETTTLTTKNASTDNIYSENLNGQLKIMFDTPKFDLEIIGGTIVISNLNYAVISGTGGLVTLTGKDYNKATKSVTKQNPYVVSTDIEKVVNYSTTLTSNVDLINSLQFIRYKIKSNFLMSDTKVGDIVTLNGMEARVVELNYDLWQTNIYCDAELEVYYG